MATDADSDTNDVALGLAGLNSQASESAAQEYRRLSFDPVIGLTHFLEAVIPRF
jgi:hypothetical protein